MGSLPLEGPCFRSAVGYRYHRAQVEIPNGETPRDGRPRLVSDHVGYIVFPGPGSWVVNYPRESLLSEKLGVKDRRGGQVAEPKLDPWVAQPRGLGLGCDALVVVGIVAHVRPHRSLPREKPCFRGTVRYRYQKGQLEAPKWRDATGFSRLRTRWRPCEFYRVVLWLRDQRDHHSGKILVSEKLGFQDRSSGQVAKIKLDPRVAQLRGLGFGCEPVWVVSTVNPFRPHGSLAQENLCFRSTVVYRCHRAQVEASKRLNATGLAALRLVSDHVGFVERSRG